MYSHASLLVPFIDEVCKESNIELPKIDAVAISIGPGSYTGLRIGLSTAKGICYTLNKPLIAVSTLKALANGMIKVNPNAEIYIPTIDARRNDAYLAGFNKNLEIVFSEKTMNLNESLLHLFSARINCFVAGTAFNKFKSQYSGLNIMNSDNIDFSSANMIDVSLKLLLNGIFSNVVYVVPRYLKQFYSSARM